MANSESSYALFINATHSFLGDDSKTLTRLFFPEIKIWKNMVKGTESPVSLDKAKALIEFEPEPPV